tara:strand:+ start:11772 stop:12464 length:693 start_codon:yes stop_codon:yes gene_type:complete
MNGNAASPYISALRFRWLTPLYDAVVRATTRERHFKPELIDQATIQRRHRVLDLACGTGTLSILIKQRYAEQEVFAIDGDPAILSIAERKARKRGVALRFDQGFSQDLPYPDAHFDRLLSSLFFHHLSWDDKQRTAAEILRVLKPGGELHVADWGMPANSLMRAAFRPVQWLDGYSNTQDNAAGKLMPLFSEAGFVDVIEHRHINTLFGTLRLFSASRPTGQDVEENTPT